MAIISFAKTKDEYLDGKKSVTRRDWTIRQHDMWQKFWGTGNLIHDAYDKSPRAGGKKMGQFELTVRPYHEQLEDMPLSDLIAEGGMCKTVEEFCQFIGKTTDDVVTVIRFKKL